jgi:drug/metabolite transporter (DMT)-like permease
MVLWRTLIAAAILLPTALFAPTSTRSWRDGAAVAFAAVTIAILWVALGSAEQHITSSLAGLLIAGVPLVGVATPSRPGR